MERESILSKLNYRIHTDAIKENLILNDLTRMEKNMTYASEADVLNVALFGMTAKEWREKNPGFKGNIRDMASIEQLIVLVNLENLNADYIKKGMQQYERLFELNKIAREQLKLFIENNNESILNRLDKKSGEKTETE